MILTVNGIRYRSDAPWTRHYIIGVIHRYPQGIAEHERPGLSVAYSIIPLPRIPGWPLIGPAPQFLSDDPKCILGEGDQVIIYYADMDLWHVTRHKRSGDPNHDPLGTMAPDGRDAWLFARADPEADA